jgi:hypothetical protein
MVMKRVDLTAAVVRAFFSPPYSGFAIFILDYSLVLHSLGILFFLRF